MQTATLPTRNKVLSLYRSILHKSQTWSLGKNIEQERQYILQEAKVLFRMNMDLTDQDEIDSKILEAEERIALAEHYGIPYPRPFYHISKVPQAPVVIPNYLSSHASAAGKGDIPMPELEPRESLERI